MTEQIFMTPEELEMCNALHKNFDEKPWDFTLYLNSILHKYGAHPSDCYNMDTGEIMVGSGKMRI